MRSVGYGTQALSMNTADVASTRRDVSQRRLYVAHVEGLTTGALRLMGSLGGVDVPVLEGASPVVRTGDFAESFDVELYDEVWWEVETTEADATASITEAKR